MTTTEKAIAITEKRIEQNGEIVGVEAEGSSIMNMLAQIKQSVGDLALFDDISVEADVDQAGPRAKSHFRFRCYRRSGG